MKMLDFVSYRVSGIDKLSNILHTHNDSYEILHLVEGSGLFVIGGKPYPFQPGALYLTNAIHPHCSRPKGNVYVRSKLTVNASYLDELFDRFGLRDQLKSLFGDDGGCCILPPQEQRPEIDRLFSEMEKYHREKTELGRGMAVTLLCELLIRCITMSDRRMDRGSRKPSTLAKVLSYINTNLTLSLNIETIAAETFVSKYHLCRMFKQNMGVSIMQYILSQRLSLAKKMLVSSEMKCSEVAMMSGFSGFSYFCRVFKQQEGISPNQYRSLHKRQ